MSQIKVVKIGDVTLNFMFSFRAFCYCAREMGNLSLSEFMGRLQNLYFEDIPAILFAAYENACFYQKTKVEYTVEDATLWIDEIGLTDAMPFVISLTTDYVNGVKAEAVKDEKKTAKKKEQATPQ